ncbi:MBL fold metallo-hydrolase [Rhodomicrobium sp. Az07]|uniref:MBL fold metallo-hydrolase n=1 Tax=Rhodomicrobium sp. Az07 TaxID=2839034 RepID=UPI001BE58BB4|nr:MBL fold metallo-hydrolase [Rhodomicrobium sp. Az07]MBT3070152.1 MBL fold metallo-hydrolase [Rhodomicrobium sp. Az07]
MELTVIGCGDAFASGGRFNSCYLLDTSHGRLMIDCGATSPHALKRAGVRISAVDAILISHCHGDHFGGLPSLVLDRMFIDRTEKPMEIFGPPGIESRFESLMESVYPGILGARKPFEIIFRDLHPGFTIEWRGLLVEAFEVDHFSGSPSLALSICDGDKQFSFSGDSGFCGGVIAAGRGADLYLVECSTYSTRVDMHLDYQRLAAKFSSIGAKRYLLTHMGDEMLAAVDRIDPRICMAAADGLKVTI